MKSLLNIIVSIDLNVVKYLTSNPTEGMEVCVYIYSVFVLSCG
jgi:hypothetical protein